MLFRETHILNTLNLKRIFTLNTLLPRNVLYGIWGSILFFIVNTQLSAQSALWRDIEQTEMSANIDREIIPQQERLLRLDTLSLAKLLAQLPAETTPVSFSRSHIISLPMPDGSLQQFYISRSSIMAKGLQDKFPKIQTYAGIGIDDIYATLRFDWTPHGFHAMVLSPSGTVFIDPYARQQQVVYSSYYKTDFQAIGKQMICAFQGKGINISGQHTMESKASFGDCQLRSYRLALAATGEYTQFHGGSVPDALAAMVTTMNRVNGVYQRDLGVQMELIANNQLLIYTDGSSDPYSNGNASTMLNQNQNNINNVIGAANYDIGHVFGTNSGGVAGFGVVCSNNSKARGVTGGSSPIGDPFDIDYVAHEIGHQFGASHTFNGTASSCSGNGSSSSAFEPGSGSTIMAYAGICGNQNVQSNSDAYFHARSLEQISNFISSTSCANISLTNNNAPTILQTSPNLIIPASTPFFLEAEATDADGDGLTYCWEQYDNQSSPQPPSANSTVGPNFRSFDPEISPRRYFPQLSALSANINPTWEVLSNVSRSMRFRLSVRDNALPAACTDDAFVNLNVDENSGPFVVQSPNTSGISWAGLSSQTITWDVANTDLSPINCAFVNILLSTDGGMSFTDTLASQVPNTGSYSLLIPNTPTSQARILVAGYKHIFFDISDEDFQITAAVPDFNLSFDSVDPYLCISDTHEFQIHVGSILGFSDTVDLSVDIQPNTGLDATLNDSVVVAGDSAILILQSDQNAQPGNYSLTVSGNSSTGIHQIMLNFQLINGNPAIPTLNFPQDTSLGVSTAPVFDWDSVSGAAQYELEISTDFSFNQNVLSYSGITESSFQADSLLNTYTLYYWRVKAVNPCGMTYSPIFNFMTAGATCNTYVSQDVPKNIPSQASSIQSILSIPDSGKIQSIRVINLQGTHSWINDLVFTLTSPSGTTITLIDQICDSQNNFNITLDDQGDPHFNIPCPPTDGGTYQPAQNLAAFAGEEISGDWTLTIDDLFNQDGGSLDGWGLEICYDVPLPCTVDMHIVSTDISCFGACDGSATISLSDSLNTYTYAWSDGSNSSVFKGLCEGVYSVIIADSNQCLGAMPFTISEPSALTITANPVDISCFGAADGMANVSIQGGTQPYTQDWGGIDPLAIAAGGNYTGIISDANGCQDSVSIQIIEPAPFTIDLGPDSDICPGGTDLQPANSPHIVSWLWSTGDTTATPTIIDSGLVWVMVTDTNNCVATDSIYFGLFPEPIFQFAFTVNGPTVTFQNGSTPASFQWAFGDGNSSMDMSPIHSYADTGVYQVTLIAQDANGCGSDTLTEEVHISSLVGIDQELNKYLQVYPNPARDLLTIRSKGLSAEAINVRIFDYKGRLVHDDDWNLAIYPRTQIDIRRWSTGIYSIVMQLPDGRTASLRVIKQ